MEHFRGDATRELQPFPHMVSVAPPLAFHDDHHHQQQSQQVLQPLPSLGSDSVPPSSVDWADLLLSPGPGLFGFGRQDLLQRQVEHGGLEMEGRCGGGKDKGVKGGGKAKKETKQRFAFQTRSTEDILDDGFRWRKYGQKAVKNSKYPRSYYRCTHLTCDVKKQVQRLARDPGIVVTTYEGIHNHPCEKLMETLLPLIKQLQFLYHFSDSNKPQ